MPRSASALLILMLAFLVATAGAARAEGPPYLSAAAKRVFVAYAQAPFQLDCTYADRDSSGFAEPAWDGQPAMVYVKPWVCTRIDLFLARRLHVSSRELGPLAQALLVLTHEATHVSDFPGARVESLTECHALQNVWRLALALGAPKPLALALGRASLPYHAALLAANPSYQDPACQDGGALDEDLASADWPN